MPEGPYLDKCVEKRGEEHQSEANDRNAPQAQCRLEEKQKEKKGKREEVRMGSGWIWGKRGEEEEEDTASLGKKGGWSVVGLMRFQLFCSGFGSTRVERTPPHHFGVSMHQLWSCWR